MPAIGIKMIELIELDSPEDNFVNPDEVMLEFLKQTQTDGSLKYLVSREKKGVAGVFGKDGLELILPSKIESMKPAIIKSILNGFGFFAFSLSCVDEVVLCFSQSGYVMTEGVVKLNELPISVEVRDELLELVDSLGWKGSVIFTAHDGYPVYILDITN
jgi:hypothetical protein